MASSIVRMVQLLLTLTVHNVGTKTIFYIVQMGQLWYHSDGVKEWYQNGIRHREDGPAIVGDAAESWFKNGKRHREDGPAIPSILMTAGPSSR